MMGTAETGGSTKAAAYDDAAQRLDLDVAFMLVDLANGHVLSESQARRLYAEWFAVDEDAWAQPWLRDVREHTRMYIQHFGGSTPI